MHRVFSRWYKNHSPSLLYIIVFTSYLFPPPVVLFSLLSHLAHRAQGENQNYFHNENKKEISESNQRGGRESYRWQGFIIYRGPSYNVCITNLTGACFLIKALAIDLRLVISFLTLGHAGLSPKSHFRRGCSFLHQLTSRNCIFLQLSTGGNLDHKAISFDTSSGYLTQDFKGN